MYNQNTEKLRFLSGLLSDNNEMQQTKTGKILKPFQFL